MSEQNKFKEIERTARTYPRHKDNSPIDISEVLQFLEENKNRISRLHIDYTLLEA